MYALFCNNLPGDQSAAEHVTEYKLISTKLNHSTTYIEKGLSSIDNSCSHEWPQACADHGWESAVMVRAGGQQTFIAASHSAH